MFCTRQMLATLWGKPEVSWGDPEALKAMVSSLCHNTSQIIQCDMQLIELVLLNDGHMYTKVHTYLYPGVCLSTAD